MDRYVVTTHYEVEDIDMSGDYCNIDISVDGIIIQSYGDSYHDKGQEKMEGFIEALLYFKPDSKIVHKKIADWEF